MTRDTERADKIMARIKSDKKKIYSEKELMDAFISEVNISKKERREIEAIQREMKRGKEINWRKVLGGLEKI
jgi:uncharacterized protein YabE (DUF348 family)